MRKEVRGQEEAGGRRQEVSRRRQTEGRRLAGGSRQQVRGQVRGQVSRQAAESVCLLPCRVCRHADTRSSRERPADTRGQEVSSSRQLTADRWQDSSRQVSRQGRRQEAGGRRQEVSSS